MFQHGSGPGTVANVAQPAPDMKAHGLLSSKKIIQQLCAKFHHYIKIKHHLIK
jgi:hypothetical protein